MPNNVDFITAVKMFFMNYANFRGRSTRAEYWWAILGVAIINCILIWISPILYGLFYLAIIIPQLAILTRRVHDIGKSGWWVFGIVAAYIVSYILIFGGLISAFASGLVTITQLQYEPIAVYSLLASGAVSMAFGYLLCLAAFIVQLVFCVTKSAPDNQYGPDPYGAE